MAPLVVGLHVEMARLQRGNCSFHVSRLQQPLEWHVLFHEGLELAPCFSCQRVPWWADGARNEHGLIQSGVRRFATGIVKRVWGGGRNGTMRPTKQQVVDR